MSIEPDLLEEIFTRLGEPVRARVAPRPPAELPSIVERGWLYTSQIEDYAVHFDRRLINFPFERMFPHWDLQMELVLSRPKYVTSEYLMMPALSLAHAASLFIRLERIGFEVDPQPLTSALGDRIKVQPMITSSEFDVLAYERTRNRYQLELTATDVRPRNPWQEQVIRSARGIRVKLITCDSQAYRLEARSINFRAPAPRRFVTCDYCGYQYTTGDLQSRDEHRTQHARFRRLADPAPRRDFAERLTGTPDAELVLTTSPMWMHREVYERAVRFKRDFGYDFTQWAGTDRRKCIDAHWQGHLFDADDESGTIVGACAFWFHEDENRWEMMWAWISPRYRRQGVMSRRWIAFLDRYGDFSLAAPFSHAMHAFILRRGTAQQQEFATRSGFRSD